MTRVLRFLRGAWLGAENTAAAGYNDHLRCRHIRQVFLEEAEVVVRNQISGFTQRAGLRWRLAPSQWELSGDTLRGEGLSASPERDAGIKGIALVQGWESRYYPKKIENTAARG
jgi:hypothetical protein